MNVLETAQKAYQEATAAWEKVASQPDTSEREAAKNYYRAARMSYLAAIDGALDATDDKWKQLDGDLKKATKALKEKRENFEKVTQIIHLMANVASLLSRLVAVE